MKCVRDPSVSSASSTMPKYARVVDVPSYFMIASRLVFFIRLYSLILSLV